MDRFESMASQEVSLERKPGTYFGVDLSSAGKAGTLCAADHGNMGKNPGINQGITMSLPYLRLFTPG